MAWYSSHDVRFRGRIVRIFTRYACYEGAKVMRGKSLDLRRSSRDTIRLQKLFYRWLRNGTIEDGPPDFG